VFRTHYTWPKRLRRKQKKRSNGSYLQGKKYEDNMVASKVLRKSIFLYHILDYTSHFYRKEQSRQLEYLLDEVFKW
jgi:hypothetical protein